MGDVVNCLVESSLVEDGSVRVEVDDPPEGLVTRGVGHDCSAVVEKADKTFQDATPAVTSARSLIGRLRSFEDPPDEVGIVFGVQPSAQSGAFIASLAAEANFTVSMIWRRRGDKQ